MKERIIGLLIIIYLFNIILCQNIFVDYACRAHEFPDEWNYTFDSLRSWGASIYFPSALHDWSPQEIEYCDQVWLIGDTIGNYSEAQKISLIRHLLNKKKLILLWTLYPFPNYSNFLNEFLMDTTFWKTTAEVYGENLPPERYITKMIFNYYNFTNGIDSLYFVSIGGFINCGNNCYPFIFREYHDNPPFFPPNVIEYDTLPVAAIIFPFIDRIDCSYILILTVFHSYENMEFDYINYYGCQNYKLLKNFFFAPNSLDFPCPVPEPYQISVTSIPPCANPGDTVRICGRNLWRGKTESLGGDIEIYIGATEPVPHEYDTIVIPIRYSQDYTGDSTWLEFIMPDLPPGTYPIRLGHKAITFDAGDIIVPCPMVAEIPECANSGDTVVVSGINLLPDIVIQIDDTIIEPINYALEYDTLEFVCPSLPPGDHDISFFWDTLEIFSGSILIPCPTASASFPECADPGDTITISGENLVEPISITVGDSVVSSVSYSEDRSKVSFRCPWLPRGQYQVNLSWHDMFVASGTIEIPCPHRCERFPNPITPNFDAINDFAQFEFDEIFVKPARIHIFDIHGHEIWTIDVPAGLSAKQHARWDGTDDSGNPVPEGVYIYTIEVAGEIVCEGTVTVAR